MESVETEIRARWTFAFFVLFRFVEAQKKRKTHKHEIFLCFLRHFLTFFILFPLWNKEKSTKKTQMKVFLIFTLFSAQETNAYNSFPYIILHLEGIWKLNMHVFLSFINGCEWVWKWMFAQCVSSKIFFSTLDLSRFFSKVTRGWQDRFCMMAEIRQWRWSDGGGEE